MNKTKIEWCDYTWSPVTGCTPVSEGCENCYAQRILTRFKKPLGVILHQKRLFQPLTLRKPAKIFVCSMSDLFHENVPTEFISAVWAIMQRTPNQIYLILTKRPKRMKQFVDLWIAAKNPCQHYVNQSKPPGHGHWSRTGQTRPPLSNVWLGVSAENQARADERLPLLIDIPAVRRFASLEPLLGPVNLSKLTIMPQREKLNENNTQPYKVIKKKSINLIIVGGETGAGARECKEKWIQQIYEQCQEVNMPFFFKQSGKKWVPMCIGKKSDQNYSRCFCSNCTDIKNWEQRREWPK